jgi:hypothetical protein
MISRTSIVASVSLLEHEAFQPGFGLLADQIAQELRLLRASPQSLRATSP